MSALYVAAEPLMLLSVWAEVPINNSTPTIVSINLCFIIIDFLVIKSGCSITFLFQTIYKIGNGIHYFERKIRNDGLIIEQPLK
jgi:hypothetical protein